MNHVYNIVTLQKLRTTRYNLVMLCTCYAELRDNSYRCVQLPWNGTIIYIVPITSCPYSCYALNYSLTENYLQYKNY